MIKKRIFYRMENEDTENPKLYFTITYTVLGILVYRSELEHEFRSLIQRFSSMEDLFRLV